MVGPCVNNLPVRASIADEIPVSTWLKQLQHEQFMASQHQYSSIEQIQNWSGIPWRHRLFDSLMVFQNYSANDATGRLSAEVTVEVADAPESTNYPLTLTVVPGSRLNVRMLYKPELFEAASIRRVLSALGDALRSFAYAPGAALGEIAAQLTPPPAAGTPVNQVSAGSTESTPRTEMERTVAAIWRDLFGNPDLSLEANFFDLGGHSLLLVQAHKHLEVALGRNLPIVTLLQHSSVRALAQHLAGNAGSRLAAQGLNERARRQQEAMARMKTGRRNG
jgi:non-ribosomal peptide synthetase component F